MSTHIQDSRLNFRLTRELKETIERAAAELGQSVTEFALSILIREAREVLTQSEQTHLSNRDRERFIRALEDSDATPNEALKAAAKRYRKRVG